MRVFLWGSAVCFLAAGFILFRKYRIIFGGVKATGRICRVRKLLSISARYWKWLYEITVEVNNLQLPALSEPVYWRRPKVGESRTVWFHPDRGGYVVLADDFFPELSAALWVMCGILLLFPGLLLSSF